MFHKEIFSTYGWIGFPIVNSYRINEVSEMVEGTVYDTRIYGSLFPDQFYCVHYYISICS